jgi:hypothetical protein
LSAKKSSRREGEIRISVKMKLRGQITQLGLAWLDRLLPLFEKMNKNVVTLYFNPTQMSLVLRPEETGGVDAHADVSIFENNTNNNTNSGQQQNQIIFEQKSYVCSSAVKNQIAFKVDSNGLLRVVKGLVNVNATGAHVKLLRREHKRRKDDTENKTNNNNNKGNLTPVLCFSSFGGEIDIVQDVPIYGPLNRKDVEDIAAAIDTRRFEEVPYWLDLDYQSASVLREATERLKFVSARVEVVVGREGAVHIAGEKTATASAGVELRGVPVAPRVEMDDDHDDENEEGGERRKRRRGTTTARTAQLRLAEMRAVAVRNKNSSNHYSVTQQNTNDTNDNNNNASLPPVATRGILSAKQLGKGFLGTMTRPDVVFFGFADNARRLEMVHRFYSARQVVVDKETGTAEESQDSVIVRFRIPVEEEEDEMEADDDGDDEENATMDAGGRNGERRGRQHQQQGRRSLVFAPRSPAGNNNNNNNNNNDDDDGSLNTEHAARALLGVQKKQRIQQQRGSRRNDDDNGDRDSFLDD